MLSIDARLPRLESSLGQTDFGVPVEIIANSELFSRQNSLMSSTPCSGSTIYSVFRYAMLLESLREQVLRANQEIARRGLAPHTFGNASGVDRSGTKPLMVIKPSGVDYASMTTADLVVTDLDGNLVEGSLRPSSDLDTHTLLYREFPQIGGIVHTHSEFATSWAQAGRAIPCLGTTHADYFHGPVPVTKPLTEQ
jgi:L-ribulose-5-phosphate 4-epimerase